MRLLALFLVLFLTVSEVAEARSRFGRSFGRRGTRKLFQQKKRPSSNTFKRKQAPKRSTVNSNQSSMRSPRRSGGFMRSMMGAVAGTMIGGMIFRALGMNTGAMGAGGSGGGMGFFFILLLLGGGAFLYFRYRKRPQYAHAGMDNMNYGHGQEQTTYNDNRSSHIEENSFQNEAQDEDEEERDELDMAHSKDFINDRNKDFFSVQHAWSKKDLSSVKNKMTDEIHTELMNEIQEMNQKGHTSTLENVMINNSEAVSSWAEQSTKFVTFKFDISLIEYELDQNGQVVRGKKDGYTDVSEYWTFCQNGYGQDWLVSAIENPMT